MHSQSIYLLELFKKYSFYSSGNFLISLITKKQNKLILLYLFFTLAIIYSSCRDEKGTSYDSPGYNPQVSAFTSGTISAESNIRIMLAADYPNITGTNIPISEKVLVFTPDIKGNAFWVDERTIEFRPEEKLLSGTSYNAELRLSRLFRDKKDVSDFKFSFSTIPLNFDIEFEGLRTYSQTNMELNGISGKLVSTDNLSMDDIVGIFMAKQDSRNLPVRWTQKTDAREYFFMIDSVRRTDTKNRVVVAWDGSPAGVAVKGSKEYLIPGLDEFTLMECTIIQQPEQYVLFTFSDPIKANQVLTGLIHLENNTDLRFSIDGNLVKAYPVIRQDGAINVRIEPGIQNALGYKFKESITQTLNFEPVKPGIRLIGKGVIVPQSDEVLFPFEAVALKAIEARVIQIFEDNVAQFLQVNQLDGGYELRRAGRLVAKKTIQLTSDRVINYNEWNAFSIDLSNLIEAEPGAIYRVELSFRRQHSIYECPGQEPENEFETIPDDRITENEIAYYDSYSYYYDGDGYYNYRWSERHDPCSPSYYYYGNNRVARNVLATNLGIIAKAGNDRSMLFAVTDLRTTEPIQGVELNIYNFQNQIMATLVTDRMGMATVKLENQPYLLVAKKEQQRAYLRLDAGSSLSLSRFDVTGASISRGIKGFIYGERGVWRPGDSIYLSFILEDKLNQLPQNHPVLFELYNPQGKKEQSITSVSNLNGFHSFHFTTSPDAPTGSWNARISIGNIAFNQNLRIETIKPNRLRIELDFGTDELRSNISLLDGKIISSWLHGAPAANLKANVSVMFRNIITTFPGFPDFVFNDPSRDFAPVEQEIFSEKLNSEGTASLKASFSTQGHSPGKVNAIFTSRVFEKGGDFSISQQTIPYSPYPAYAGLKVPSGDKNGLMLVDSSYVFEIISVNEEGKLVSAKNLEVKIYKLKWQWWWHSGDENLASYTGSSYHKPVFERLVNAPNGKGHFSFKVDYPDWGRFFVRVYDPVSKHSTGKIIYFDWPGWAGRGDRGDPAAASILSFSADKEKYLVGETARITFPTAAGGRALLSIENGSRVIDQHWIQTSGSETSFSFAITKEMSPNVFVAISYLQPHKQTLNDLPVRMYGITPLLIDDPATHLIPVIEMADILKPESLADIIISELNGKEMTYTIAMVDEGLLDLTRFRTPDPWKTFYAREALGVKSFDIYDMVLGAYGGRFDGVFSIGGDEEAIVDKGSDRTKRFPPVVRFLGPYHLSSGKSRTHKIEIPNYVGSVKTMVVAGYKGAYGNTEKVTPVKNPLMVLATLPRVLGPSETVSLPVTIFALEEHVKNVNVKLQTNDVFDADKSSQTVQFSRTGDTTIEFLLKVKNVTGKGKVKIIASSGREQSIYEIELDIRSPNPPVTRYLYGIVDPGESWNSEFELPGMQGTNTGTLEVSSMPPVDFGRRLKFLLSYPHGCLEQIVSGAFPLLYLADVMETNDAMQRMIRENVLTAINKVVAMQLSDGSLAYWPGATSGNDWGTSYSGHFMLEARRKGYHIPETFVRNWIGYQRRTARNWTGNAYQTDWQKSQLELAQAYRLYTLALSGNAETGAMNRLRERPGIKNISQWRLAAAYALAGQPEPARLISEKLTTAVIEYSNPGFTYGSYLRDKSMILEAMILMGEREKSIPLLQDISEQLRSDEWYSTQTLAYSLIAVSSFIGGSRTSSELSYDFSFDNEGMKHAAAKTPFSSIDHSFKQTGKSDLKLINKGEGQVYVRLALHGTPAIGQEIAYSSNLQLEIDYLDMTGNPVNPSKMEQGTDFIAVVSIYNPGKLGVYRDMALTKVFPSGWEIQNLRLFDGNIGDFSGFDYQDIRDDRVYTYFDLNPGQRKKFAVKLNASYKGRYYLPGVGCESMYRNDIAAMTEGQWVEVVEPGIP